MTNARDRAPDVTRSAISSSNSMESASVKATTFITEAPAMTVTGLSPILAVSLIQAVAEKSLVPLPDFTGPEAAGKWQAVNDGVMGGVSDGRLRITPVKTLEFFGTLSLENNGGFASVRTKPTDLDVKAIGAMASGFLSKHRGERRDRSAGTDGCCRLFTWHRATDGLRSGASPPSGGVARGRWMHDGAAMAQNEWFYENGGKKHGPVTPGVLKRLASNGQIAPLTLVWKEGLDSWVQARSVRGLFAENVAATPTPREPERTPPPNMAPWTPSFSFSGHPIDALITILRQHVAAELPERISRLAGAAGIHAVYGAAALLLLAGVLLAIRMNAFAPIPIGIAAVAGLLVLQYTAYRLLATLDLAITANKSFLSSSAIPDCLVALVGVGTLLATLGGLWTAVRLADGRVAFLSLATLLAGAYTIVVAAHRERLGVILNAECRAAEEAIGVLTFFIKLFLRFVPVAFAITVVVATLAVGSLLWKVLRTDVENLPFLETQAMVAASSLLGGVAIPLAGYCVLLFYYLMLDVLSAILSLPAKIDALTQATRAGRE